MQEPTFEEMIPWMYNDRKAGSCPWDGDVYFVLSGTEMYFGEGYIHRGDSKSDVDWGFQRNPEASVIAYMPVKLWEEGYRRPSNDCLPAEMKVDICNLNGRVYEHKYRVKDLEWAGILLWKPSQSAWNPTAAALDDMTKHCEENMEEIMTDNRPLDFMGSPLFGDQSLEDLFELYQDYKQEKESAENMMAKVVQEVEYRTPDEWNIELKDKEEEAPSETPEEAIMNDWQNWGEGDILKCVFNGGSERFSVGARYEVISYDEEDQYQPVFLKNNEETLFWPHLGEYGFIKVEQ